MSSNKIIDLHLKKLETVERSLIDNPKIKIHVVFQDEDLEFSHGSNTCNPIDIQQHDWKIESHI